jgi:hypothetical protein
VISETFLDSELVEKGGQAAHDAATKNQAAIADIIAQVGALLDADFGDGADSKEFKKAHREVRSALDLAARSLGLIEETAWNVKTAAGNTKAADEAAEAVIKSIQRAHTEHLRS